MFTRVALPTAVPEALSYSVPEAYRGIVRPGVRVRVRLRGAARVGLVVATTDDPGCPPARVLPVEEVLDTEPAVPPHVLELIAFAADYYHCPVGMVVRAAVPAQLLRIPPAMLRPGPRAVELLGEVSEPARRLLERLIEGRRLTVARLEAEGFARDELRALVEELARRQAVKVTERRPPAEGGGRVTAVVLAEMAAAERQERVGRAPAQQRVVECLESAGRALLEAEVRQRCRCSAGVIAELVRKGVLRRFTQARRGPGRRWELTAPPVPERLSEGQDRAVATVVAAVEEGAFRGVLLQGVTGSGKTEVYLRAARRAVDLGRQVLILVPEIGLTPALAGQLAARFGERVAVLHSSMADGERFAAWERARRGEVDVVAGPRSALWAPLERIGLVVVDEEQDASYKQDEDPRYNARDLALLLGQRSGVPVVLGTATPSLEAVALAERGRLETLDLPERVSGGRLPAVEVVDLRDEEPEKGEHGRRWLSARLRELLTETLERGEQAILLVNRRGWAPVLLCRECGHQVSCGECSVPMTVHRRLGALVCHYCGASRPAPVACPRCGGEIMQEVGAGTEKIAAKVAEIHPDARIEILDRDTARSPAQLLATLERFAAGESNVLVGTQMVSKGHHFPAVTLTGVISADNLLGFPDFRGAERTFQLLTQVAGRAGRGPRPGTVVVQTYHPDHHAVTAALTHDVDGFVAAELRYRRAFRYPPASRMALLRFEAAREVSAIQCAEAAAAALDGAGPELRLIGPAPAPLERLRGRSRVQLLLMADTRAVLHDAVTRATRVPVAGNVRRIVDVDPQSTI